MRIILALAVTLSWAACAVVEEKAIDIPLKSIWALDMPGTRDIHELEPEIFTKLRGRPTDEQLALLDKSLTVQFVNTLKFLKPDRLPAKGFAVSGAGLDALTNAKLARLDDDPPPAVLPNDKPISIVFFSHSTAEYVRISDISRRGDNIEIRFRLVPYQTMNQTRNFALIPLGKLPAGEYAVDITTKDKRPAARNVCKPFSFTVEK